MAWLLRKFSTITTSILRTTERRIQLEHDVTFATAVYELTDENSTSIPSIHLDMDRLLADTSSRLCSSPRETPILVNARPITLAYPDVEVPSTYPVAVATPVALRFDGVSEPQLRPRHQVERAAYVSVTAFHCGVHGQKGIGLRVQSDGGRLVIAAILSNSLFSGTYS